MRIHVFLISWPGQHDRAIAIARALVAAAFRVTLVYSDDDPDLVPDAGCVVLRRPQSQFWADKFKACLDAFDGDTLLIIHADCSCKDWPGLVRACAEDLTRLPRASVWAPLMIGTPFPARCIRILSVPGTDLDIVAHTDGIVFALKAHIVRRMQMADYSRTCYGWGIDLMFVAHAYAKGQFAVVNRTVLVRHSRQRGYPSSQARAEMQLFLRQLSGTEQLQQRLLAGYVQRRDGKSSGQRPADLDDALAPEGFSLAPHLN